MSHTNKNIWVRLVDVPCYRKHAKGYTAYQIILKVFPGDSPEACAQICVWKRFSEIFSFYRTMCNIHRGLFLKGSLPQLPSSNYFKRFEPEVVEQRRTAVLAFFRAILLHTPLFSNEAFTKFFQDGEHSTVNQLQMVTDSPLLPSPIVQPSTGNKRDADTASQLSQLTPSVSTEPSQGSSESADPLRRLDHHHQQQHESMSSVLSDESSCESAVHHDSDSSDTDLATLIPNLATLSTADSSAVGNDGCDSSRNLSPDLSQLTAATDDDETVSRNFSIDGVSEPVTCGDVSQLNNSSIDGVGDLMTGNEVNRSPLISIIDSDNTGDYLIQGSTEICLAQEFDRQGKYWEAFNQYSKGIGTLLNGVQGDMVHQRRESVRARLVSYLDRAEQLDSICRNLTPADTPQV